MEQTLKGIAGAIREEVGKGRSHGQLAVELKVARRLISLIVCGERGIGARTLLRIMAADPPWLREVLAGALAPICNKCRGGEVRFR